MNNQHIKLRFYYAKGTDINSINCVSTFFFFQTILTITVCNLALALVWDQIEKMVHIVLVMMSRIVSIMDSNDYE